MKIHLTTFNIFGVSVPDNRQEQNKLRQMAETWLYNDIYTKVKQRKKGQAQEDFIPDIFVVGLQEMVPMNIQGFLESSEKAASQWSSIIADVLNMKMGQGIVYVPGEPLTMFGLALFVFVRQELNQFVTRYDRDNVRTGGWGPLSLGEKGGVAISMTVGSTTMCFVNCHLAAGVGNLPQRIEHWNEIRDNLSFDNDMKLDDHEYVFWIGDMNSRLVVQTYDDSEKVQKAINENNWPYLVASHDELTLERIMPPTTYHKSMFHGYKEGLVTFAPTYKYQIGTQMFVNETPSFTDRILWRRKQPGLGANENAEQLVLYDSTQIITISDHRPVTALMDVVVPSLNISPQTQLIQNPPVILRFPTSSQRNGNNTQTKEVMARILPQPAQTVPQPAQTVPQPAQTVPQPAQTVPHPIQPLQQPLQTVQQPMVTVPQPTQPVQTGPQQPEMVRQPKIILQNVANMAGSQGAVYQSQDQAYRILNAPAPTPITGQNPYSTDGMTYVLNQINTGERANTNMPTTNIADNLAHYRQVDAEYRAQPITCRRNQNGGITCQKARGRRSRRPVVEEASSDSESGSDGETMTFQDEEWTDDSESESADEFESIRGLPRQRIRKRRPANPGRYGGAGARPRGNNNVNNKPVRGGGGRRMRAPRSPPPRAESRYGSDVTDRERPPPEVMAYARNAQLVDVVQPAVTRPASPEPGVLYELYPLPVYDMPPPPPTPVAPAAPAAPAAPTAQPMPAYSDVYGQIPAPPKYVSLYPSA